MMQARDMATVCRNKIKSVLVVEDEALILFDISSALEDAGYDIAGEAVSLAAGWRAADQNEPEVAVLDINVGSETVWPLARHLVAKGAALVFVSANLHHDELKTEFACWPRLEKPVRCSQLVTAIEKATAGSAG